MLTLLFVRFSFYKNRSETVWSIADLIFCNLMKILVYNIWMSLNVIISLKKYYLCNSYAKEIILNK